MKVSVDDYIWEIGQSPKALMKNQDSHMTINA